MEHGDGVWGEELALAADAVEADAQVLGGVVWDERVKGEDTVTINLGGVHASVKVFDPTAGTEPVQNHAQIDSLKLTLSDHPLIIAIPRVPSAKTGEHTK